MVLGGADSCISARFSRKFSDQKHQTADALAEAAVGFANLDDSLVYFPKQDTGIHHFRR